MKIGVNVIRLACIEDVETAVARLEGLGLDNIWLPDHLLGYYNPEIWDEFPGALPPRVPSPTGQRFDNDAWLDPFSVAAVLARRTRLPIGTCVTDGTRRRAADLFRTMLTLNQSAQGGFILGIGGGEAMSLKPFGYDHEHLLGNLETTLMELRSLLDTGCMPNGGGRTGLLIEGPAGPPQVWVAASADRSLKLAGRYGDGWFHLSNSIELYERQHTTVLAAAEAAGRPAPTTALVLLVILGESRAHVIEALERSPGLKSNVLLMPAAVWEAYGLQHPAGPKCRGLPELCPHDVDPAVIREISPKIPTEMIEQFLVIGNAEEIAAKLKPFAEAGVDHFIFTDATVTAFPPEQADELQLQYGRLAELMRSMGKSAQVRKASAGTLKSA